jgi:hypothetical protein
LGEEHEEGDEPDHDDAQQRQLHRAELPEIV